MRAMSGMKARDRKSNGGAAVLCVPPEILIVLEPVAVNNGNSTVCSTSVQLPAVPILNECSPAFSARGSNVNVLEPTSQPSTRASEIAAAALTAVTCWRSSPGFSRRARMCSMRKAWRVQTASDKADRKICPPPSPSEPSMTTTFSPLDADDLLQRVHDLHEIA